LTACALAGTALAGCAHTASYDASYLAAARRPPDRVTEGKALVETSAEDDAYVYTGPPTSMTGAAHTLSVPLGAITKESAKAVYADRFSGGSDAANGLQHASGYRLIVAPKVTQYSYAFNQLKNLGFAITPSVEATLRVRILNPDGSTKWEKEYASGPVEASSYMVNMQPHEEINKLTHKVIYDLLVQSSKDVLPALKTAAGT
jgi:hypothetical protein